MLRRMGRPGLLGTMARTAVITGTASATANAVRRRELRREQEASYAEPAPTGQAPMPPPQAPASTPPPAEDLGEQLSQLASLHAQGALSDEEFAAAKQRLLG